jgi:hypothetical protein
MSVYSGNPILSESDDPFSLRWCCEHLNLDVQAVRTSYLSDRPLEHYRIVRQSTSPSER